MAGEEPSGDENQDDKDDDGNKTDAAGEANNNKRIGGKSKKALEGNHSDRNEPRYIQATTITTA